jgi:drug/metabolite transporter (DMT)-like permease
VALNIAAPLQRQFGGLPVIGRTLFVAMALVAPFGIAALGDSSFAWRSAVAVAALGAFGTGLAYVLMASNAGRYGSTRAASTTYLIPGVSLALGLAFRGESVHGIAIVGSLVALAGAYLVNTGVRRQPPGASTAGPSASVTQRQPGCAPPHSPARVAPRARRLASARPSGSPDRA